MRGLKREARLDAGSGVTIFNGAAQPGKHRADLTSRS
jgi:hypothetical protein